MKYTAEQLEMIARHFNLFVDQDDDGNVVGNTDPNAEAGWRPIYADKCQEAIEAQSKQ
jgi:hypothetical protein